MVRTRPRRRVALMGAAARDYHNFLCVFRDDPAIEVVAFTSAQMPGIASRRFPAALAGRLYPDGIPIVNEELLEQLIAQRDIDEVVLGSNDLSNADVMHRAARVLATGAGFRLLGTRRTMLRATLPVIAVSTVHGSCLTMPVTGWIAARLVEAGLRVAVLCQALADGDLVAQRLQHFATPHEPGAGTGRGQLEPLLAAGAEVWAGIDCRAMLDRAEAKSDVLVWFGTGCDFPYLQHDLHIVLVDALDRAAEQHWNQGEAVLRTADIALIARADGIAPERLAAATNAIERLNPAALVVRGSSNARCGYADLEQPGLRGALQDFLREH